MKLTRRDFLRQAAVASSALAAGGVTCAVAPAAAGGKPPLLASISGVALPGQMAAALSQLLAPLGGMSAFVKKGQTVLLKPNMGFPTPPSQHATTSPELVACVARLVIACGAKRVLVMDNPTHHPEACMRLVGMKEALKGLDVHLFMPTSDKMYVDTPIPRGKVLKQTKILGDALRADVHIALPIAKSHNAAGFTGTVKGMMGLILDRESFHARMDLNQAIADLFTVLRPHLVIMDGLMVMTTDGPAGPGELVTTNTLLAGTDALAVDAAGVTLAPLYGRMLKPQQIKHLKLSAEMGLGVLQPPAEQIVSLTL